MYLDVLNNISSMSFFKTVALNRINWCPLKLQLTRDKMSALLTTPFLSHFQFPSFSSPLLMINYLEWKV